MLEMPSLNYLFLFPDLIVLNPEVGKVNEANYIFSAIDVFTKMAFSEMMTTKSATDVCPTFEKILNDMKQKPKRILCDQGRCMPI